MTHWKEQFDERFYYGEEMLKPRKNMLAVREFISQTLEKLIDDIPDVSPYSSGLGSFNNNTELKQKLKDKWL